MDLSVDGGRAVVFGPGGLVGTAWLVGLVQGLRIEGVDVGGADRIVGSSAGAIAAALVVSGRDLGAVGAPVSAPPVDPGVMGTVFAMLGDQGAGPEAALRRVGRWALEVDTRARVDHLARLGRFVGPVRWPECELLVTSVEVESGRVRVWGRGDGVSLVSVVAASCAVPGVYPPVEIGGRRYFDGGLGGGSHVGLAEGARVLVVVEPLAGRFGSVVPRGAVRVVPDAAASGILDAGLFEGASWGAAFEAGVRQGRDRAGEVGAVWGSSPPGSVVGGLS